MSKEEVIQYLIMNSDILQDNKREELFKYYCEQQLENQQLKEQLEKKYKKVGSLTNEILYEENTKLLSVLDEIREYIEHEWFKRGQLGIIDKSFQEWQLKDILQILDKVKE